MTAMNKVEKTEAFVKANHRKMENAEIVKTLIKKLDMSEAGARTYVYNARKSLGLSPARNTRRKLVTTVQRRKAKKAVAKKKESVAA